MAVIALFRDMALASVLGTSAVADAFHLAFFVPDTIGNNLIAATVAITCVPVFSKVLTSDNRQQFNQVLSNITFWVQIVSLSALAVVYLIRKPLVRALTVGSDMATTNLCLQLMTWMLPVIAIYPLVGVSSAALQVIGQFALPAAAPILSHLAGLICLGAAAFMAIPTVQAVWWIASAMPAGGLCMVAWTWLGCLRHAAIAPHNYRLSWSREITEIGSLSLPYITILLSAQSVLLVERSLASQMGVGTAAGLNYAYRLAQVPLWVLVSALGNLVFPKIARETAAGDIRSALATLYRSMFWAAVISIPPTLAIYLLRRPLIQVLLGHGAFGAHSIEITARILTGYCAAVVFQGLVVLCQRFFLAMGRPLIPMLAGLTAAMATIIIDHLLIAHMGPASFGVGATLGAILNLLLQLPYLYSSTIAKPTHRQMRIECQASQSSSHS